MDNFKSYITFYPEEFTCYHCKKTSRRVKHHFPQRLPTGKKLLTTPNNEPFLAGLYFNDPFLGGDGKEFCSAECKTLGSVQEEL